MSYSALGIWPFDSAPKAATADAMVYNCWSDDLNSKLQLACQTGGDFCSPANVAYLLGLDYCEGECPGAPSSKGQGLLNSPLVWVGAGALAFGVVLALKHR